MKRQRSKSSQRGIALVEVTIVLPFLLLLLVIIIDFGRIFYEASLLQGRLNAAARYLAMSAPVGECKADFSHKDQCDNARKLARTAWGKGSNPGERFTGFTASGHGKLTDDVYDHWKVSVNYHAEFTLLPDMTDFTITLHAVQRGLVDAEESS